MIEKNANWSLCLTSGYNMPLCLGFGLSILFYQGGLDVEKRKDCADQLTQRQVPGFAVGGLSGGEAKSEFWKIVKVRKALCLRTGFELFLVEGNILFKCPNDEICVYFYFSYFRSALAPGEKEAFIIFLTSKQTSSSGNFVNLNLMIPHL